MMTKKEGYIYILTKRTVQPKKCTVLYVYSNIKMPSLSLVAVLNVITPA